MCSDRSKEDRLNGMCGCCVRGSGSLTIVRILYDYYCIIIMNAYDDDDDREAEGPASRATMIMMIIIMIITINNNDNDDV